MKINTYAINYTIKDPIYGILRPYLSESGGIITDEIANPKKYFTQEIK